MFQTLLKTGHVKCISALEPVEVYYEVHGSPDTRLDDDVPKVLLIMGFAAPSGAWLPQVQGLLHQQDADRMLLCVLDNRGIGRSSAPSDRKLYSTPQMAADALAVVDHLGWQQFSVVGFSMGGMIATKLAVTQPRRVQSLTLISVSAGRWDAMPTRWKQLKYALRSVTANTPEARAQLDLKLHFSKSALQQWVSKHNKTQQQILYEEYVTIAQRSGSQPKAGMKGQLHAVWQHSVTAADVAAISGGGFPVLYIHGLHDLVARHKSAVKLAKRMAAPIVLLDAAHFVTRECQAQVNALLREVILRKSGPSVINRKAVMEPIAGPDTEEPAINGQAGGPQQAAAFATGVSP